MKKRKYFLLIAFLSIVFIAIFNAKQLPVYRMSIMLSPLLLLLDFLIWKIIRRKNIYPVLNYIFIILPASILVLFILSLSFDIAHVNVQLLNILFALLSVFYIPKIIFIILILSNESIIFLRKKKTSSKRFLLFSFSFSALLFFFMVYKTIFPVMDFNITKHEITINKDLHTPLKIVHISDLHLGSWLNINKINQLTYKINELNPDLIFVSGDLVNFSSAEISRFDTILRKLKSKHGVYSVLGNHDYGNYIKWNDFETKETNLNSLVEFKKETGWHLLMNESLKIINETDTIFIVGVENWGNKKRFPQKGDIELALKTVNNSKPVFLLSHDPSHWEYIISKENPEIDITFSGHSHAGQIGSDRLNFGIAKLVTEYWGGLYENGNSQFLSVNKGIGFIGLPFRIGIRPEITEITVSSENKIANN
ncbi:MAG: metallophosphoesterase [Bacteroidota bacterium]